MVISTAQATSDRQILVALGNRFAVFGQAGRPRPLDFSRDADFGAAPPVSADSDALESRIAGSLRVAGMRSVAPVQGVPEADVELLDEDGNRVSVEIRVRDRDPQMRDIEQAYERLIEAERKGDTLEAWHLNVERLKLFIQHLDHSQLRIDELAPLDVWERTAEGVFDRASVAEEADDWVRRVGMLYDDVTLWLGDRPNLRCEQDRSVVMSEDIMEKFAVGDREIPLLDVVEGGEVVASFVPRGLWLIGSWGRIDIITKMSTSPLLAVREVGQLTWRLARSESENRRQMIPFDKAAFFALIDRSQERP